MPYLRKKIYAGSVIETYKYFTSKLHPENLCRAPKQKKTSPAVEKNNERIASRNLCNTLNANFGYNDLSITLTYDPSQRPAGSGKAASCLRSFLKLLRGAFKNLGSELKYIATTEYGKTGKFIHHHLVISKIDHASVSRCWKFGWIHFSVLDNTGDYSKLARYMIKETTRTFRDPAKKFSGKRWSTSRNLVKPKIVITEVSARSWRDAPMALKGYYITDVYTSVSEATGYPYQYYKMVKIPDFKPYLDKEDFAHAQHHHHRTPNEATRHKAHLPPGYVEQSLFGQEET